MVQHLCDSSLLISMLQSDTPVLCRWFTQNYGDDSDHQRARYLAAVQAFEDRYGRGPIGMVRAPARINLIGEHIDYVDYFRSRVLPFGSREHDMLLLARPRKDDTIALATTSEGFAPLEFRYERIEQGSWLDYLQKVGIPDVHWGNYIKGSAFYLQYLHPQRNLRGADLLVDSTIPVAGGASSSSALVVTSGAVLRLVNDLPLDADELAEASSKAEWYVGTRGGKMDHATICCSRQGQALRVTFEPFSAEPIPMPAEGYRWVTFYTHPAEKGDAVMGEYNERSIVSRFLIPWMLEDADWGRLHSAIERGDPEQLAAEQAAIERVLGLLPESMSLQEVITRYPDRSAMLRSLYPALFEVKGMEQPVKIRDRGRHHFGEILRVFKACQCLMKAARATDASVEDSAMRELGELLSETHASLRDFYDLSTPDLETVVRLAEDCDGVYGARVMGGGFGGNVLTLVRQSHVSELIARIGEDYYRPRGRTVEGNVMVSSPGNGLQVLDLEAVINQQRISWANDWRHWEEHEDALLAACPPASGKVRPVIVAAGRGERARQSGLDLPKPLAPIRGKPVIRYVLDLLLEQSIPMETPIVVVNPEDERLIRDALQEYRVDYVTQQHPLGTAHAVWETRHLIEGFDGDVVVVWGTQPVIQPKSISVMLQIHQSTGASMSFPTTKRSNPYAPIVRDEQQFVIDSVETHQEGAERITYGEDNIGIFCLKASDLLVTLAALHERMYDPKQHRYRTASGELGFPNQMVRALARQNKRILALALADPREAQGIKVREHLAIVERHLDQLER